MGSIRLPLEPVRKHERLIVLLPGLMDDASIFFEHDFHEDLLAAHVPADLHFVDTEVADYSQEEIVARLREEVLEPARAVGYREIWLVGVSVGGYAALCCAKDHPSLVYGLVVLSPFLGRMVTTGSIRRAGGLAAWRPPRGSREFSCELWRWLQGYAHGQPRPPLYLAYGARENDCYWGYSLLAEALPRDRVITHPGIHGWKTWKPMWPVLIERVWPSGRYACTEGTRAGSRRPSLG